jgi:gliding motility-associated-like protein
VTDQKIVTVHSLPTVTVNDPTICAGEQTTLTAVGANGLAPYTYAWSPSAGLSAVTGATVTTSPPTTTSYTATVTDANSCTATDANSITVNPIPTSDAGPDITICTGSGANTLVDFSPTGGTWSGTGVTSAGIFTPTVTGLVTLTYSVIENGCTGTNELEINVINPTAADAGLNQALCQNAPDLTLSGLPVNGAWTGTNVTNTGVFTPLSAGTFTLTYTIGSGSCSASDNVEVLVYDLPIASVNDPAFCIGLGTTLTASATGGASPYSYAWNASTDLSTLIGATTIANPSVSSDFTVTVTDDHACTDTEISQVQVNALPLVDAGSDVSVCNTPTETTLIGFSPNGGTWTGNGVTSDGIFTPTGVGNFDLTYTFTDANGCINSDIVTAAVTDPDNVQAGIDQEVCQNSPDVQLVGSPTGGTWIVSTYLTNTGLFSPTTVGDYSLKYTVGTGTCAVVDSLIISVLELPLVAGSDVTICAQDSIEISVTGSLGAGNYSYTWSPTDNLILSIDSVIQAFPVITTTYTVTVTDENTCTGSTDIVVNVNQLPIVEAGADFTVCFTPIPTLLSGESPLGGTWFGNGVTNGEFVPPAAGTETIYYTYTEASTGCINLDSILVTANNPAIVNAGNDTSICVTYDPFLITGNTPLGGVWTGDSQVSPTGTFTATQVGPVTLTYTSGSGTCAVSDDRIFTVQALPVVEAGSDTSICVNSPVFNFSGESPITAGTWTWTGIGISDGIVGTFSASQSSAGVFTSLYTYIETATGCRNADSLYVTVNSLTPVNVVDETLNVCLTPFNTLLTASPIGGVWTGNDINFIYNINAVLDTAGFIPTVNGVYYAFYTYTDSNNCVNADTSTINVVSPIDAVAGPDVSFCYSTSDTYQLSGSPIVGTWTDPLNPTWLLEDGTLTPIEPDTTNLIITIGSGSCQTWDTTLVVVFPLPFIDAGVDTFRCFQDPCFQLSAPIPTGGIWSGNGITDPNGTFCSTIAGEGIQVLQYNIDTTYYYQTVQSTCLNEDSTEVLVVPMPVPGLSIDPVLCVNVDYTLGNVSSGPAAEFEWTILSLPLNDTVFFSIDPAPTINLTVAGNYQLILNSISPYGCSVSTSSDFIVVTPPVPEFAISDDLGCAPYQGLIANTSSGYDLTYSWDFGPLFPLDLDVNPIMPVFPSPVVADSTYYVQLSLTNLCGTRTYWDSVVVRPQPFALITTDYSIGCSPMNIVIQNISYGSPESFLWDFGNGTTSNDSLPDPLVFSAQNFPQVFNIIVEVTNSCGISKDTAAVVIYPSSFSIGSIVPQTACAPYEFSFQSPLSGQTLYLWDFGDGEGAVGENVTHLYNDAGSYTLQLTVSNFCFTDTVYSTLNLLEGPSLDFDLSANSICENNEVSFTNNSTIGSLYQWLIDGTALNTYSITQNQSFTTGGLYQIGLAGTNPSSGCRDTIYSNFDVVSRPIINVIASPDTGCSPLTAQFINTTTNATSYQWMFSDGTGSSALSPTVVIPDAGNFSAELIAHNYQTGLVDCPDTAQINVLVHPTPQSMFSLADEAGCGPPASVQTNNQSSSNLIYTWTWENQNSIENSPLIVFADTGYKAIQLKVTNEFMCSDSSVLGYRVYGQPSIAFDLLPADGCAPLNVDFQNLTQYGDSISWGFGDGNFSNLSLANHTYSEAGFYPVEVHVSSGNGLCFDDTLVSQAIHVFPVAYSAFQVNPLTISQTSPSITLYNSSSGYTDLEFYIDSNLIGNELPGTYLFENPDSGYVQLILIANNEFNCPDTTFTDVYVQSAPNVYYPDAFSPNGDGVNDEYKVFFDRAPTYYHVRIYDRWGHIVFKSYDYEEAWNGTYLNRGEEPIKSDVYVLKFSAFFEGSIRIDDLYKNVVLVR